MGEPNAKRLLEENKRLRHEQQELCSVLGEEKDMVRYLHGVIKNYEHLLRSNSKRENQDNPSATRKMADTEAELAASVTKLKPSASHTKDVEEKKLETSWKEEVTAGWQSLDLRHDTHGLQTVEKPAIENHDASTKDDDICLEDLDCFSISSADELTDGCSLTPEMERRRFSDRSRMNANEFQGKPKVETSRIYEDKSRSRDGNQKSVDTNRVDDYIGRHSTTYIKDNKKTTSVKETIKKKDKLQTRAQPSSMGNRETSTSFDKEIDDLNKQLDKIASTLNKYEKSLYRSEKHLGKIAHRMEYLESFALGQESEYL